MKKTKLSVPWLYQIIEKGECEFIDFKESLSDKSVFGKSLKSFSGSYEDLAKDVVAFSNYKGGFIVIGITDKTKEINIDFKFEDEQLYDLIHQIQSRTYPDITLIPHKVKVDNTELLIIEIPFSTQVHSTTKGEYYIRTMNGNKPLYPHEISTILSEKNLIVYDQETKNISYEWFDENKYNKFIELLTKNNPKSSFLNKEKNELLEIMGFIREENKNIFPTVTGILILGNEKSLKEFPFNNIKYIQYFSDGTYKPLEYSGDIIYLADNLFNKLKDEQKSQEFQFGLFREYVEDYPDVVLRELLINSIIHRDYTRRRGIEIRKYENYLEIESPGLFPEGITPENCLRKSNPKNPTITDIFREIKYCEKAGSGFDKVFTALLLKGKSIPEIEETESSIVVRVYSSLCDKKLYELSHQYNELKKKDIDLDKLLILDTIIKKKKVRLKDLEANHNINKYLLKKYLDELIEIEFIETTGKTSDLFYILHKNKSIGSVSEKNYLTVKKQAKHSQKETILRYIEEFGEINNTKAREILNIPEKKVAFISKLFKEMIDSKLIEISREPGHNQRFYKRKI